MKPYTDVEQSRLNVMTQEEKAKRYDEAIERAKNIYGASECKDILCTLETIFPELRESEDERIRKAIIEHFANSHCCMYPYKGFTKQQILAWLEKQGNKPADKVEPKFHELRESADKFDSKFHEGDWVVQENIGVYKVIEVCESWYEVIDGEYNHYSISFDEEYMCHLWGISDAKDGDVLVTIDGERPFIYKGRLDPDHPNSPVAYCGIGCDGYFCTGGDKPYHWWTDGEVQPATKKQHDQLEKAMADAGYAFDIEKKELEIIDWSKLH